MCAIRWASGLSKASWELVDVLKEVDDLARLLGASFFHIKQSANSMAVSLAKGVECHNLIIVFGGIISM